MYASLSNHLANMATSTASVPRGIFITGFMIHLFKGPVKQRKLGFVAKNCENNQKVGVSTKVIQLNVIKKSSPFKVFDMINQGPTLYKQLLKHAFIILRTFRPVNQDKGHYIW